MAHAAGTTGEREPDCRAGTEHSEVVRVAPRGRLRCAPNQNSYGTSAVVAVLGVLLLLGLSLEAQAFGIQFEGGAGSDPMTFTGNGSGSIIISTPPGGVLTLATYSGAFGLATFHPTTFMAGPGSGGTYLAGANAQGFDFAEDGNGLVGTITWTALEHGNTNLVEFVGTLQVNVAVGSAAFLSDFYPSSTATIDFVTTILGGASSLDELSFTTGSALAGPAFGGVQPAPEPTSLLLFASALIGVGAAASRCFGLMT
jgi:hypothetical protein